MKNRLPELLPGKTSITTDIVIETSLAGAAQALLSRIGFAGKSIALVCDTNTHAALGKRLMEELSSSEVRLIRLEGKVRADDVTLKTIRESKADAFIAVGGGTISDLCKYVSFADGKPYAVFPTAPSMNGYLSANASLSISGIKESRPAHLPVGVFCDLKVISSAPVRLIRAGLGDSLCRPTAQGDWLLSHLLLDTAYAALPFDLLKPYEAELFAHSDKLVTGDLSVIELLLRTLLVSGLGMMLAGGSYPASQGEHLIVHTMEMKHGNTLPETFHGEQIGVATLTMARLQQELLSQPLQLPPSHRWEGAIAGYLGRAKARNLVQSVRKKYELYDRYDVLAAKLAGHEKSMRDAIRQVTLPPAILREVLKKSGAPLSPADLGWNTDDYDNAAAHACFTRDRFTFLDLL